MRTRANRTGPAASARSRRPLLTDPSTASPKSTQSASWPETNDPPTATVSIIIVWSGSTTTPADAYGLRARHIDPKRGVGAPHTFDLDGLGRSLERTRQEAWQAIAEGTDGDLLAGHADTHRRVPRI